MSALGWVVAGLHLAGAAGVVLLRRRPVAAWLAPGVAGLALVAALGLPWQRGAGALLRVDALAAHMAVMVSMAAVLALWLGRAAPSTAARAQVLVVAGGAVLAVLADGPALGWAGLAAAALALLRGVARGGEAGWRAALALVPALGLALLGAVMVWLAAGGARPWQDLVEAAPATAPGLLSLGWMLLLAGLAVVAGLAPVQSWLRAARGGSAAAVVPALAAAALVVLLRARELVMAQEEAVEPGPPLLALGMASLAWAALGLWRERRPARDSALFVSGLAAVAFGLGGDAVPAGLLLLGSGVVLGPLVALAQGWMKAAALAALALLPPFPGFGAAVALLGAAADAMPWLAVPLAALVLAGAGGLARAALLAWRAGGAAPRAVALPAGLLMVALVASGMVPAAARWFELMAEGLR